jgi:hypothetical protein
MDIKQRLSEEHSKSLTMAVVDYIAEDKTKFKILMDLFLNGQVKLVQRAAWPLSYLAIAHPKLIKPYLGKLIIKLQQTDNHPSVPRNILRILEEIEIPEKYEAYLVACCFSILTREADPIASKAYSITVASKICKKYPDLKNELRLHLEHIQNYPITPAIKFRIKRAIKEL